MMRRGFEAGVTFALKQNGLSAFFPTLPVLVASVLGAASPGLTAQTQSQTQSQAPIAQPATIAPAGAGTAATATPSPYLDRVMDSATLADEGVALKFSDYNPNGWPRSLRIDYSVLSQKGASSTQSRAVGIGGFLDTPDHGALSLNANLSLQNGDTAGNVTGDTVSTWRIDQRGLPLEGGWRANHSAGDINTSNTSLARGLGRVSLPTTPIRGLGGQWYLGDALGLNAAAGRTGLFNGLDLAGFEPTGARVASAGGQVRLPADAAGAGRGRSDAAFQVIDGRNIADGAGFGSTQNTSGFWAAVAWDGAAPWSAEGVAPGYGLVSERQGGLRLQGNVAKSNSSADGSATGLWADASWRTEHWRNTAGLFRFDPSLRWGTALLASDIQGVYWQADTSTRQWQAGYSVELSDSVSHGSGDSGNGGGVGGRSAFANLNGRYRLDTRNALGAALSVRALTSPGEALQLTWDQTTELGQTQWRGDFASVAGARTTRLGIDQSWPVAFPNSLNTSLAWERTSGDGGSGTGPGSGANTGWIWGVLGTLSPYSQWSLDTALRGARRSDGAQSLNANVGVRWQPTSNWSLALRYTQSRGQDPLSPLVVSALTTATLPPTVAIQSSQSLQLVLRYEESAGRASAPLGGTIGAGAGTLSGSVYFDADANGRREASEGGVPGVTIILDRRFVTRTDAQGRYEFPAVAAGEHVIEVSSDNVPLPWSPALRDPVKIRLYVRQLTTQDFAVQRER